MKILVTGGAGFIGSHLVNSLLNDGHVVYCLDNLFTGKKENIKAALANPNFHFIFQDVVDPIDIDELDQIYHLACPASPVHYQYDPIKTSVTSVTGTINMLELALKTNARFLLTSTSEVYGDPEIHPQPETYWGNVNPIGPRSCYDEGKRMAETLTFDYHREKNVDIRVVRIFNTYGPQMSYNDGRVVSNFITQAIEHNDITIYGNGSHTRCFCYVSDMVNGIQLMMDNESFTGPVNLGSDYEISVKYLSEIIIELTKSQSKVDYKPLPENDPKIRQPDLTLAKQKLNWESSVNLEQGLKETINYFLLKKSLQETSTKSRATSS